MFRWHGCAYSQARWSFPDGGMIFILQMSSNTKIQACPRSIVEASHPVEWIRYDEEAITCWPVQISFSQGTI